MTDHGYRDVFVEGEDLLAGWLTFGDVDNFNRERMASYLDLPRGDDVSVVKSFPPERIFNLVGTDPRDYTAVRM